MIHSRMGICQSVLLQTCNTSSMTETFGHEAVFIFFVFITLECMLCTLLNVKSCILLLWDEGRASGDWPLAGPSLSFAWMTSAAAGPVHISSLRSSYVLFMHSVVRLVLPTLPQAQGTHGSARKWRKRAADAR